MGFRVDFFQLYSISKSTGTRCTTALLPDPVIRWLSVSVSSHHCWISSIISSRMQLTLMKRPNSWLARWLRCSASSFRRGSQLLGTSAQTRRNEIITKYQTDFLYASIVDCHGELSLCPRETTTNSEELLPSISSQPLCWEMLAHFLLLNTWFTIASNDFSRVSRYLLWFL